MVKIKEGGKNIWLNLAGFMRAITRGILIWPHSRINKCHIEKNVKLYNPYVLNHVSVGTGTYISQNSNISYTTIGKYCSLGPNLLCGWGIHPITTLSTHPAFYSSKRQAGFTFSQGDKIEERKPIIIGNDVFIGANVTILDGVIIGDGCIIGAGAIVSKNIPPYAIAYGNPIQIVKYRFSEGIIQSLLELKWWDGDALLIKRVEEYMFDVAGFIEKQNAALELNKQND